MARKKSSVPRRVIIPYRPYLKELARDLRNNATKGERLLWKHLKGKQLRGYDFHRQKPLGRYIVDFFCYELMLVIEVDGGIHLHPDVKANDEVRQQDLERFGLQFIRFEDELIRDNAAHALRAIQDYVDEWEAAGRVATPLLT